MGVWYPSNFLEEIRRVFQNQIFPHLPSSQHPILVAMLKAGTPFGKVAAKLPFSAGSERTSLTILIQSCVGDRLHQVFPATFWSRLQSEISRVDSASKVPQNRNALFFNNSDHGLSFPNIHFQTRKHPFSLLFLKKIHGTQTCSQESPQWSPAPPQTPRSSTAPAALAAPKHLSRGRRSPGDVGGWRIWWGVIPFRKRGVPPVIHLSLGFPS